MYQKTTLKNGLRLITSSMPHLQSVCISIFVKSGSRYETREESGVSHFIEHLCFKGTEKRPTSRDISTAIDEVGGVFNGGTDRELTVYWCKTASTHFPLAVDVLADILLHSKFNPQDIDSERRVIIQELDMQMDSPHQRVHMLINELLWPEHPLGREIGGTKETVTKISRQAMTGYAKQHYTPDNIVISIAGGITQEEALLQVEKVFGDWDCHGDRIIFLPANDIQQEPHLYIEQRKIEQSHLCLAVPGLSDTHPDRFALDLLNTILGGGMSSRLFTEIRDKRGLAYAISSYEEHLSDTGSMTIYAGVRPDNTAATITAILKEMRGMMEQIPKSELTKAKEQLKGQILLRMENSSSVSAWMGGQELLKGKILTVNDVGNAIDAVTAADIQRIAQEVFVSDKLNLALVGPDVEEQELKKLLQI
ncbi:MAG: insulinase family protein [Dehalococcoidia bacterium]|nr:insulinase family protein [Dehalococcoidia bacterium]